MENKELFIKKYGKMITKVLHNIVLREDILKNRIDFILKSVNDGGDVEVITALEDCLIDKIQQTGKVKYTEEDIEIMLRNILLLEIRDYDKSHLVDLSLREINSLKAEPKKDKKSYTFGNTTITEIGSLKYEESLGVQNLNGLPYYKIDRINDKGKIDSYKVFSHINIGMMESDSDYREAVLETLLDENNMTRTNCGGYIGTIEPAIVGASLEDTVKANSKYSLVFDSTDATAVVILREAVKHELDQKKESGFEH